MRCIATGLLRALLDNELPADEAAVVTRHLQTCERCADRMAVLRSTAQASAQHLAQPSPVSPADVRLALAHVRARAQERTAFQWRISEMAKTKVWRTALAGVVVTGLVVALASFAPARALAAQLLGIFRVKRFAVVQVQPSQADITQFSQVLEQALGTYELQTVVDEPVVPVSSAAEASATAGFQVRMPEYLPWEGDTNIEVKGRTELSAQIDRTAVALLLDAAGMDSTDLPADWPGGEVRAIAPAVVSIVRGNERRDMAVQVMQVWNPEMQYPAGLEPGLIGEAALRMLGVPAEQAHSISQQIDWTSTLLLPIPTNLASFRETEVAGGQAILVEGREQEPSALIWQRDDVLYAVISNIASDVLSHIAESMY